MKKDNPIFTINGKAVGFVKDIHLGQIESDPISIDLIDFSYSGMVDNSCKCSLRYGKEFNEQYNKVKQITMNKQIIEQIEKIKGVKYVEPMNDRVVVTFEAPKIDTVKVTNQEQWDFVTKMKGYSWGENWFKHDGDKDQYIYLKEMDRSDSDPVLHYRNVGDFTKYLTDYNLTDEWEKYLISEAEKRYPVGTKYRCAVDGQKSVVDKIKFGRRITGGDSIYACNVDGVNQYLYTDGKWAEIIPDEVELVDGEIYCSEFSDIKPTIFRKGFSTLDLDGNQFYKCEKNAAIDYDSVIPATKKQKQKLIKAEVKNGYFHELRSKDS